MHQVSKLQREAEIWVKKAVAEIRLAAINSSQPGTTIPEIGVRYALFRILENLTGRSKGGELAEYITGEIFKILGMDFYAKENASLRKTLIKRHSSLPKSKARKMQQARRILCLLRLPEVPREYQNRLLDFLESSYRFCQDYTLPSND